MSEHEHERPRRSPEAIRAVLAHWAREWGVDVSRLAFVDERGGEIWLDGKPEILDLEHP